MKKIILALVLSTISVLSVNAQWTPSGSNIYYDAGTVGIGSSSISYGELTIISDGQRPLGIRRNTDSGSLIRWNIGSGIVGGIYSSGTGTGIYGGSTESESQFFLSSNGNIGIGTTTPESLLDIAGDIQYSGNGYTNYIRKKVTGFVSAERIHYLLLYKSTDTATRVTGQFTGVRSHGSGNPASLVMQIEGGRGTGTNHDLNVQYSSLSGGSNGYKIATVTIDYNGDNYVAIEINPGTNSTILTVAYFEGITRKATLAIFPSDSISNVTEYSATQNLKKTAILSPLFIDGRLGIGTEDPSYKLEVNGTIRSKEVIVEATGWPDYVFEENYNLLSLSEIEAFIKANGHLPEVPSATEVEANGITLGEMNVLLLKKIEELTLHTIEQEKTLLEQQQKNNKIINELLLRIEAIEKQNDQ